MGEVPVIELEAERVLQLARGVARTMRKRVPWAPIDDMVSEASLAILAAVRTFDPDHGSDIAAYVSRAARLKVIDLLWRMKAVASGGMHKPHQHISPQVRVEGEVEYTGDYLDSSPVADIDLQQLRVEIRARLAKITSTVEYGDHAYQILLGMKTPAEVIAESGSKKIYRTLAKVRNKIKQDDRLRAIYEQAM